MQDSKDAIKCEKLMRGAQEITACANNKVALPKFPHLPWRNGVKGRKLEQAMAKPISPTQDRFMSHSAETWYVRFPDGRVIRAANTIVLRRHLDAGRIPVTSSVRRSNEEEWTKLEWTAEFADLIAKSGQNNGVKKTALHKRKKKKRAVVATGKPTRAGARLDPRRFKVVGSRAILREMLAALDSTLLPRKLSAMVYAGFALGVVAALSWLSWPDLGAFQIVIPWILGFAGVVVVAGLSSVLTQMTFLELSELRPARLREGVMGATGRTVRLLLTLLLGLGIVVLLFAGLRWATVWLMSSNEAAGPLAHEAVANALTVVRLVLEFALWPLFVAAFLLSPILIVEECSINRAVRIWWTMIRQHFRALLAYEIIAMAVAAALALPFAVPLLLSNALVVDDRLALAAGVTRLALWGCLLALPAAYFIVANVFIYLNVRYESGSGRVAANS
jgi:hypothetical protein